MVDAAPTASVATPAAVDVDAFDQGVNGVLGCGGCLACLFVDVGKSIQAWLRAFGGFASSGHAAGQVVDHLFAYLLALEPGIPKLLHVGLELLGAFRCVIEEARKNVSRLARLHVFDRGSPKNDRFHATFDVQEHILECQSDDLRRAHQALHHIYEVGKARDSIACPLGKCPISRQQTYLVAVQAGVPLNVALDELSLLLSTARDALRELGIVMDGGEPPVRLESGLVWPIAYMLDVANALQSSILCSVESARNQTSQPGEAA